MSGSEAEDTLENLQTVNTTLAAVDQNDTVHNETIQKDTVKIYDVKVNTGNNKV